MDHETFIDTFEAMGFDVEEEEPPQGEDRGVVLAENDNGDELWWSVIDTPEAWGVHIEPQRATLDQSPFLWSALTFEANAVVIEDVSGTRSKTAGYGVTGFDGEVRIDPDGLTITEKHTDRHRV